MQKVMLGHDPFSKRGPIGHPGVPFEEGWESFSEWIAALGESQDFD